jgi:hypothetical protein
VLPPLLIRYIGQPGRQFDSRRNQWGRTLWTDISSDRSFRDWTNNNIYMLRAFSRRRHHRNRRDVYRSTNGGRLSDTPKRVNDDQSIITNGTGSAPFPSHQMVGSIPFGSTRGTPLTTPTRNYFIPIALHRQHLGT